MIPLATPVVDTLTEYPELAAVLGVVLRGVLAWQRELSWYEYRTLHGLKRLLFPVLQASTPFDSFVNTKGGRDDAEFLTTHPESVRATVRQLRRHGGSVHLVSSVKRRPAEHGDPLTRAHVVWTHSDGRQTEAYLFANDDGTTDVYAHAENSATDPVAHLTRGQHDGDPRGVVRAALGIDADAA